MFLAVPINRKSSIVKIPALMDAKVDPPKSLTMKNESGMTIVDKNAEGDLSAMYSMFGYVKFLCQ